MQTFGLVFFCLYLQDWRHEAVAKFRSVWALSSVPKLKEFIHAVTDEKNKALATRVIEGFEAEIVPISHTFRKGKKNRVVVFSVDTVSSFGCKAVAKVI